MSKYIAITSEIINLGVGYDSTPKVIDNVKYFETDEELTAWYEGWYNKAKNPIIFQVAGRVKMKEQLTILLDKS